MNDMSGLKFGAFAERICFQHLLWDSPDSIKLVTFGDNIKPDETNLRIY